MKIKFLGTAAYERVPALFCKCPICEYALKHKGNDIRTQAQVLINEDLLVDFGQDNYYHFLKFGVDFTKIKHILVTHSHYDHFVPNDLIMTKDPYGHFLTNINVYAGNDCYKKFLNNSESSDIRFNIIKKYQTFEAGEYEITALPARHGTKNPFIYIISHKDKCVLYGNDSGIEFQEVYEFIAQKGYKFSAVISDCTNGYKHFEKINSHKSFIDNKYHKERLEKSGNVTADTKWIITHFSHNGLVKDNMPVTHNDLCEIAEEMGMICAYDGMEIEI